MDPCADGKSISSIDLMGCGFLGTARTGVFSIGDVVFVGTPVESMSGNGGGARMGMVCLLWTAEAIVYEVARV
jgi:hypothetical protein